MRNLLKAVAFPLGAAAVMFLARPVQAQTSMSAVSNSAPAVRYETGDDALALPRVVPPFGPSAPVAGLAAPAPAPATRPAIDLLAAPPVPKAWLAAPNASAPNKLAVVPSGLAGRAPANFSTLAVAPSVKPALTSKPAFASARPTLEPLTSKPATRVWPAAHLVRKNTDSPETRPVSYMETISTPQAPSVVPTASPK